MFRAAISLLAVIISCTVQAVPDEASVPGTKVKSEGLRSYKDDSLYVRTYSSKGTSGSSQQLTSQTEVNDCNYDSDDTCGISGNWTNELNSTMVICCYDNGILLGKYRSAVGSAEDFYDLAGRYTMSGPNLADCILGFSVAWNNTVEGNSNSTTSWTGVHFGSENTIYTKWILTMHTLPKDMWANSLIGMDVFKRT